MNAIERLEKRYIELRVEHDMRREWHVSTRHMKGVLSKLGRLITRMRRASEGSRMLGSLPARWFIPISECNVAGKGKIRVKAQSKSKKGGKKSQRGERYGSR